MNKIVSERIERLMRESGGDYMVTFDNEEDNEMSKVVSVDFDPPETFDKFTGSLVRAVLMEVEKYNESVENLGEVFSFYDCIQYVMPKFIDFVDLEK